MANTDKAYGFRPVGTLGNASYAGNVRKFFVSSATAVFIGDLVKLAGTGSAAALYPSDVLYPEAEIAASTNIVIGVCVGVEPIYSDLTINYRKASVDMYIYVDVDPMTIYSVQGDSGAWVVSNIGLNANATVGAGSTTTGRSTTVITTPTADAAKDTLIIGVDPDPGNVVGVYWKMLVKLNLHQFASGVVRLGID